jgi:hypothetical protein
MEIITMDTLTPNEKALIEYVRKAEDPKKARKQINELMDTPSAQALTTEI